MDKLQQSIEIIDQSVSQKDGDLGEEIFELVSRCTPLINVDLLIKNNDGDILLTWRDDQFYGPGWHIPGGVIRHKESISQRIHKVAQYELQTAVTHAESPSRVQELMNDQRDTRGHFISLLYDCSLVGNLPVGNHFNSATPMVDQWQWHSEMPHNLIKVHKTLYSDLFINLK